MAATTHHVFTYGSLMWLPVWRQVVRGNYRAMPARLSGFARYAVQGETYPGMVEQTGSMVDGVLYWAVNPADLARLDAFEGCDYRRCSIVANLPGQSPVAAETYLYLPTERLAASQWQPSAFDLNGFMLRYCGTHP